MIFAFNKPYRWTSFNLVAKVRGELSRHLGVKRAKVGHAGTLDPLASGVLLVCTDKDTKRIDELQSHTKEYVATIKLGATTPSFDMETLEDAAFPTDHITRSLVDEKLKAFIGEIQQVPPTYSAVKVDGKRAFKYARQGEAVELKPKVLVIDELEVLSFGMSSADVEAVSTDESERIQYRAENIAEPYLQLVLRVVCSKGTYIRALARDIGEALGSGAYLTDLVRTRIGEYCLQDCMDVNDFTQWLQDNPQKSTTE